jgi:hypothetical protein
MPLVGFESPIPAFERTKTVRALDHPAAMTVNESAGFIKYWAILNYLSD